MNPENARPRRVAHLDMDAFYASVELLRHPELRGLPLVIGGRRRCDRLAEYSGRGVITTATYEARAFGLRSGMALARAAGLCPQAVLLPADFDEYRKYSRLFKEAVARIAPAIEDRGIDEIYIDLSAFEPALRDTALAIKAAVREATGLSCSIGVAANKLLAKIASELDKPDGFTLLGAEDLAARIWPLPARRINGIGPKAAARLEALGIRTIGELAAAEPRLLVERFGRSTGAWLHEAAHGRDERPLVTEREPKSISRETTFERDLHPRRDRDALSAIFTRLCEKLAEDLRRKGYRGRSVGIKLRYDNFRTLTRDRTLEAHTDDARAIRRAAGECLRRAPLERRLRLLGVRVGSLVEAGEAADLFGLTAAHPILVQWRTGNSFAPAPRDAGGGVAAASSAGYHDPFRQRRNCVMPRCR
jgi:DNA polymerase-4